MSIKAILTNYNNKILLSCFENDEMISLSFYSKEEDAAGSVYLCRVDKVLKNINGCFVKYGPDKTGFYKSDSVKSGSIIPLQLKKEGSGKKEPLFTDNISVTSRYSVISKGPAKISVSSKIDASKHEYYVDNFIKDSETLGLSVIIRTNAQYANLEDIRQDIYTAAQILLKIYSISESRTLYSKLYNPEKGYIEELQTFRSKSLDRIITDDDEIYNELIDNFNSNAVRIERYDDPLLSLFHLYKMESNIKKSTERTILLPSGASIIIDHTEALTAIDINTHFSNSKGDKEQTFFDTNKEAAKEIIRQLRIRNISGMIIIDFINMRNREHYKELFDYMVELAKNDPCSLKIIDITELKLFELVRTKRRKSLIEQMR